MVNLHADLDTFNDVKFQRIHGYVMDHLSRDSCPLCTGICLLCFCHNVHITSSVRDIFVDCCIRMLHIPVTTNCHAFVHVLLSLSVLKTSCQGSPTLLIIFCQLLRVQESNCLFFIIFFYCWQASKNLFYVQKKCFGVEICFGPLKGNKLSKVWNLRKHFCWDYLFFFFRKSSVIGL